MFNFMHWFVFIIILVPIAVRYKARARSENDVEPGTWELQGDKGVHFETSILERNSFALNQQELKLL